MGKGTWPSNGLAVLDGWTAKQKGTALMGSPKRAMATKLHTNHKRNSELHTNHISTELHTNHMTEIWKLIWFYNALN